MCHCAYWELVQKAVVTHAWYYCSQTEGEVMFRAPRTPRRCQTDVQTARQMRQPELLEAGIGPGIEAGIKPGNEAGIRAGIEAE